jgi:hypothetical protein
MRSLLPLALVLASSGCVAQVDKDDAPPDNSIIKSVLSPDDTSAVPSQAASAQAAPADAPQAADSRSYTNGRFVQ